MPNFGNTANQALLDEANKFIKAIFHDELTNRTDSNLVELATMKVQSKAKSVEYDWLKDFVKMTPWVAERSIASFKATNYTVTSVLQEAGISVKRVDVETDNLGLYPARVRALPDAYFMKRKQDLADLIINGGSQLGYDGVSFWNAAHPGEGPDQPAQSNTSGSTLALTGTNYDTVVEEMALWVDHKGEPMEVHPTHIVVGPQNYAAARDLFGVSTQAAGGANPYFGAVEVIREPRITDASWYLFDFSKQLKPFILQDADLLELQTLTDASTDYVVMNDAFFYGIRARFVLAYGFWQLGYRAEA